MPATKTKQPKLKQLFLADLDGKTDSEIRAHLRNGYRVSKEDLDRFDILIGYESLGDDGGVESSSWFLLREKDSGELFENHASHCSCYGFEDQFDPEHTTLEYLKSPKFWVCGDDCATRQIQEFLNTL